MRPSTTSRSASRCGSRARQRRPEPVVRRADRCEVRRLLHADLAGPRLQRRDADASRGSRDVKLIGGCGRSRRRRLLRPAPARPRTNCRYDVYAEVNWGTRSDDLVERPDNFTVSANGVNLPRTGWTAGGVFTYASTGAHDREPGREQHHASRSTGTTTTTRHIRSGRPATSRQCGGTRASTTAPQDAHQAFVGTNDDGGSRGTRPDVARRSSFSSPTVRGFQAGRSRTINSGGISVERSIRRSGSERCSSRRSSRPCASTTRRRTRLLRCDPNFAQGQEFTAFRYGCQPWYGKNTFRASPWWNSTTKTCPDARPVLLVPDMPASRTARTRRGTRGSASRRRRASRPARSATTSASPPRTAPTSTTTRASSSVQLRRQLRREADPRSRNPGWLYRTTTAGVRRGSTTRAS